MDVTFVHDVKSRVWYVVEGGTITWTESGRIANEFESCSWDGSGSRPLNKFAGVLTFGWDEHAGLFRAEFSAPEGAASYLLTTKCVTRNGPETRVGETGVFNPLFPLSRNTAGFAVDPDHLTFSGSKSDSTSSEDGTTTWSWSWNFRGVR
jgi:hypothetical protein